MAKEAVMKKDSTTTTAQAAADAAPAAAKAPGLVLLCDHRHAGVLYPKGTTIDPEALGLTEKQVGWLQGVGTIA